VTWEFDVGVTTHDLLKEGVVVAKWIRVYVWSEDAMDAHLLACQIAGCHGYVTEIRYRE
jgi:hypothetical protein